MLGADTGTGKTIAYAVPAMAAATLGKRVAIATNSHALQRQMLGTPDNPGDLVRVAGWLSQIDPPAIKIARRVGKQAFISLSAVEVVINEIQPVDDYSLAELEDVNRLRDWAIAANNGTVSGLIHDAMDEFGGELPAGLSAASICLSRDCPLADHVAYEKHLQDAENADVVLISHQYMASSALFRKGRLCSRGFSLLVVDEADLLINAAESTFRQDISFRRIQNLLATIDGAAAKLAQNKALAATEMAEEISKKLSRHKAMALASLSKDARDKLDSSIKDLCVAMSAIPPSSLQDAETEVQDAVQLLSRIVAQTDGQLFASAISFSPTRHYPSLSSMPTNPGVLLRSLWNNPALEQANTTKIASVLFTSATLGVPGKSDEPVDLFRDMARSLGVVTNSNTHQIVDTSLWAQFEPEKFGAVRFILADPSVESPVAGLLDEDRGARFSDDWLEYAIHMAKAAHKAGGRTLVLTRSYHETREFAHELLKMQLPVIEQSREFGLQSCIARFRELPDGIWISPSAWEGVNLPGLINNLVITRLPMQPIDEVAKALMMSYADLTKTSPNAIVSARAMNASKRIFRQGLGRPIRRASDKARIWIADPRFPLPRASTILAKHPGKIVFNEKGGKTNRYPVFHTLVAKRFQHALQMSSVLLKNGEILKP